MAVMAAATTATRFGTGAITRSDERALVVSAGGVFALASAGAAMTTAAADAMFWSEIGPAQLGQAVALSSALLAVVLAVVGGLSDRFERRRVLASLAILSAVVIAGLAALSLFSSRSAAVMSLVGGKQLAAATDLAFWVVIAERIDARRSQRLLPILAAMGGAGAAIGALLVIPIASAAGPRGVLLASAAVLGIAGLYALRLPVTRRVGAPLAYSADRTPAQQRGTSAARPGSKLGGLITRSWRDGARAVGRHPLARHLAVVVAAAGVFGSLAYFALGVQVAAQGKSVSEMAVLLGAVRGGGQFLTLLVQLFATSKILARIGTGRTLLLAPLAALASACGLVVAPILAIAIATQVSARVFDGSLETPAEKLAQTLLPTVVRARVAGFLDGTAKRGGAVLGGLLAAVLAGAPRAFYVVTALAAACWLFASRRIARELPALAIEHATDRDTHDGVVDDRAIGVLLRELDGPRPERAAEVLARLHERGRVDAIPALARAAIAGGVPSIWRSLVSVLDTPAEAYGFALLEAAQAASPRTRELAVRAVGLAGGVTAEAVEQWRVRGRSAGDRARARLHGGGRARAPARGCRRGDRDDQRGYSRSGPGRARRHGRARDRDLACAGLQSCRPPARSLAASPACVAPWSR